MLRFTDSALSVDTNVFDENSVVVYNDEAGIHINTSNIIMAGVKIFDIRGRLILEKSAINSSETLITNLNAEQQVLIVQITSDDNRIVNRKIVY